MIFFSQHMPSHFKRVPLSGPNGQPGDKADSHIITHCIISCIISSMPRDASTCHVGVAFYAHRDFPTQWALVLADDPLFEGYVWCSNAAETTNGWRVSWTLRDWSPAAGSAFDPPVMLFAGVVHVAQISAPMGSLQAWIARRNFASEFDCFQVHASDDIPYGTDKYVTLALWRLREGRFINFRESDLKGLASRIGSCLLILQQHPPERNFFPVVPFESESGTIAFGRFMPSALP
ncbi:hypothetical protein BJV78DRAFT_490097 [Lactifluus subvellereus]|nr:hypothetical protein BJV78DRAFT_490097 [Lactifluus subvellereus]